MSLPRFPFCTFCILALLAGFTRPASAEPPIEILPTGSVARVDNQHPVLWGLSGCDMSFVRVTAGGLTPTMRTFTWDARLVDIVRKAEDQAMTWNGVEAVGSNVVVRLSETKCCCRSSHLYLLMTVTTKDAAATGKPANELAKIWASSVDAVLDGVLALPVQPGA